MSRFLQRRHQWAMVLSPSSVGQLYPPSLEAKPTWVCRGQPVHPIAPVCPGGFVDLLPIPILSYPLPKHTAQMFILNARVQALAKPSGL